MRQVREGSTGAAHQAGGGASCAANRSGTRAVGRKLPAPAFEHTKSRVIYDKDQNDEDDEMGNEELLKRALTERHMGGLGKGGYLDEISSSESENEAEDAADNGECDPGAEKLLVRPHRSRRSCSSRTGAAAGNSEDEADREEERQGKQFSSA